MKTMLRSLLGLVLLASFLMVTPANAMPNVSARNTIQPGKRLIVGFNVKTPGKYLIRVIGPALQQFGVQGVVKDPMMELFSGQSIVGRNDDWSAAGVPPTAYAAYEASVGAFSLTDPDSTDSAYVLDLQPGSYTVHGFDRDGGGGDLLVEVYQIPTS